MGRMQRLHLVVSLLIGLAVAWGAPAWGQAIPTQPELGESIVLIKNNKLFAVALETTVFKPEGAGPFPVAVINHGKSAGDNHFQPRYRPLPAVRSFLQRGFAVVVPMRQGFSRSGGKVVGDGCNIGANGEAQAEDVRAVVSWLETQAWADTQNMVMMGQSHGGLTTLAYAQAPHAGFKLFVNFAGGLRVTSQCQWEKALADAFGRYGAKTRVPSLWFYGENDSYFPPAVIQPAHRAYVDSGGAAELVAYGPFESDAHGMFGNTKGLPIWWKRVEEKLASAGFAMAASTAPASASAISTSTSTSIATGGFAALADVAAVPHLKDAGREGYRTFLKKDLPRGFALAPNGAWGWANGGNDPLQRAMDRCNRRGAGKCQPYAVDRDVVWKAK